MPDDLERRYGDREVELILRRAAELQSQRDSEDDEMSLAELGEIAERVGIEVHNLQLAADELDEIGPLPSTLDRIVGGPVTIWLERTLSGEVPEGNLEDLATELESESGADGQATLLGRRLTFRAADPTNTRALLVSIHWRDGYTHIRILERLHGLVGGLFGGVVGGLGCGVGFGVGFGVGIGALASPLFATVFPTVVLGGSFALARSIYRAVTRRRERALHNLLELISDFVEETDDGEGPDPA